MRVAFVTAEFPPHTMGGAGVYAQKVTEGLAKRGHKVEVFAPACKSGEVSPGLNVFGINTGDRQKTVSFWRNLRKAVRSREDTRGFDVVHVNGLSYHFLRRLSTTPQVLTVHHSALDAARVSGLGPVQRMLRPGSEEGLIVPYLEKRAVSRCERIIAVSEFTRGRIVDLHGADPSTITVIPNGVEPRPTDVREEEAIDMIPSSSGRPMVLFVGRLDDPRKGLDVLLRAFPRVAETTGARLVAVGKGDRSRVLQQAGHEAEASITFTGFLTADQLSSLYRQADLCVVPSRLEGYGLTVAEAMQAGRTVVASRVGAIPEVLGDEEQLVAPNDPDALATKIISMLADDGLRMEVGRRNRARITAMPTWDDVAALTEGVYRAVVR